MYFVQGANYFNYAVEEMIFMRQQIMEASDGRNDYFSTNPNVDKMMAFAFEYPMSGTKSAQFADDGKGSINSEIRKYIEMTYSPDPIPYNEVLLHTGLLGISLRFSLIMNPNHHFPVENRRIFQSGFRKYYEDSAILICRSSVPNGLAASFKLLGGSEDQQGAHNHDGVIKIKNKL